MKPSLDKLRNTVIEKIMAISDKEYLEAFYKLLVSSTVLENQEQEDLPQHVIEGIKRGQEQIKKGLGKTSEEVMPKHVIEGIKQGRADIEAGRYITFEAFKKTRRIRRV